MMTVSAQVAFAAIARIANLECMHCFHFAGVCKQNMTMHVAIDLDNICKAQLLIA